MGMNIVMTQVYINNFFEKFIVEYVKKDDENTVT